MNGHGGRRSGSGRQQLLSPEQQLHAVVLCETIKRRSSRSRTKRKLNEVIHERFPELKDNRAQFQAVPIEVRRRVFKKGRVSSLTFLIVLESTTTPNIQKLKD